MVITELFWDYIEKAVLIRKFEEKLLGLYSKGDFGGTVHTCIGQELSGVVVSNYLEQGDSMFSNHRGHGHYLSKTGKTIELFAEVLGLKNGACGGIGGSQHLYDKEFNFYSNGVQGGMLPVAAGVSLANKLNKTNYITVAFIGDGTLGEGIVYETLNIVSKWSIPLLIILENNRIAQSTSIEQNFAGDIKSRLLGFGVNYYKVDGQSLSDLDSTISKATEYCRNNVAPFFVEIDTIRLMSHSKGDDNRPDDLIDELMRLDYLGKVKKSYPKEYKEIEGRVDKKLTQDLKTAKAGEKLTYLQLHSKPCNNIAVDFSSHSFISNIRNNQIINEWLKKAFNSDHDFVLLGEDIQDGNEYYPKQYGGAFKVTKDLSKTFPTRVFNTPISEAAIVGIGTGLAIAGMKPVVEIMFGDFLTLAFDQIQQHAAKFGRMYNNSISVPLVIRTPMGGRRGYGPTHSQSIEKHFLGITDLNVIALNNKLDSSRIYDSIVNNLKSLTLVIENKLLYTKKPNSKTCPGFNVEISNEMFPAVKISPGKLKPDITIACYGEMLDYAETALEKAFVEEEVLCEIILPSILYPMNINPFIQSLNKSRKIIIVEEGPTFASWGSELIAQLTHECNFSFSVNRLGNDNIIPTAIAAEENIIPNESGIYKLIMEAYRG